MRLKDRVALITGAASGIGREAALLFAREGAAVAVADVQDDAAQDTVKAIQAASGRAIAVHADVSKATDCEQMVAATEQAFGKLDVLCNNAGIMHQGWRRANACRPGRARTGPTRRSCS